MRDLLELKRDVDRLIEALDRYRPDQKRYPKGNPHGGRFAIENARSPDYLASIQKPGGGFTAHVLSGHQPPRGFAVSPYPEHSRSFSAKMFSQKDLSLYISEKLELLSRADHYLGGWHDPDSGLIFLDVSIVLSDRNKAIALALQRDQIAVFDLKKFETITVNPDATSGGQRSSGLESGGEVDHNAPVAKVEAVLIPGGEITAESLAELCLRLTGRASTPQEIEESREILAAARRRLAESQTSAT